MKLLITFGFTIFDFITGIIKAFKEKEFTSSIMREGLYHKVGEWLLIMAGLLADYTQKYIDIGIAIPVTTTICAYIIIMELGSIVENIGKINPQLIPEKIKPFFHKLKEVDKNE